MQIFRAEPSRSRFRIELIKPSHYDDDGYVIQWVKAWIPSNSLASLYGLARQAQRDRVLGPDIEIRVRAYDETNTRLPVERIVRDIRRADGQGLVCLVGVQSNQFPRAMDLARRFRAAGLQVAIGGFHVSGCLAMLPSLPPDLQEAQDLGICLFAGESEGRFNDVLRAAFAQRLEPLYNFMDDLPALERQVMPYLPPQVARRYAPMPGTFDAGRGCPFVCSFCTIINVQGRKSRYRHPDDIERLLRANLAHGIRHYFITDDNFARNRNWEAIFDRIIAVRQELKVKFNFTIQVDTMCHTLPNFVDKARAAGVSRVFLGLENVNPDNLKSANKKQNKIANYRAMLLAWQRKRVTTYCGYILGFPDDTPERIRADIATIQRELPLDILEFFCLTPLPGSVDHRTLYERGAPLDADMNIYDRACLHHSPADDPGAMAGHLSGSLGSLLFGRASRHPDAAGRRFRPQPEADHGNRPGVLRLLQVRRRPPAPGRISPPQGPHRPAPRPAHRIALDFLSPPRTRGRQHLHAVHRLRHFGVAALQTGQTGGRDRHRPLYRCVHAQRADGRRASRPSRLSVPGAVTMFLSSTGPNP